jgi:hypothetical protein
LYPISVPNRSPDPMSIGLADGRVLDIASQPMASGGPVEVTVIEEIQGRLFHSCPICWDPATDDEHVPPASLGGKIMTRTCGPCNHRLGSHVEADLADWYENALTLPRFGSSGIRGDRKSGRILWRTTPAGEFVLLMNGRYDPAIIDMLKSGQVDLAGLLPDRNRYHLALLKHAYLAACMKFGVLQGDAADEIRQDLIAARDAASRQAVPESRLALGLTVLRRHQPSSPVTAPVVTAVAHEPTGPCHGVLLAGRVFVSWSSRPFDVHEPAASRQLRATLQVGGRLDGARLLGLGTEKRMAGCGDRDRTV